MNEHNFMVSMMFYCPQDFFSAIFEKRVTDRRADRQTDKRIDGQTHETMDPWMDGSTWTHQTTAETEGLFSQI